MTRSNGSGFPPNGWPAGYPQPDPSHPLQNQYPAQPPYPQQAPQQATSGRPARIQPPASTQGRPAQPQAPQYGQPQPGYAPPPSPPYGQPPQDPYALPQSYSGQAQYGLPQASQQAPQYAPQPQRQAPQAYAPQSVPMSHPVTQPPPAYQPQAARAPMPYDHSAVPTTRPTAPPQRPPAAYANPYQQLQQPGYPPPQQAPSPYNSWQGGAGPSIDPQGYDLGAYMPAPVQSQDPRTGRPTAPPSWQQPVAAQPSPYAAQTPAGYHLPDPGYGSLGTPLDAGFEHEVEPQVDEHDEVYDDSHDEDYQDGEASRPRYGLIIASIVVAFAIGGGLTYGYKAFFAPNAQVAGAPLVKSGSDPFKVKPSDPGGTKFSNTEAKVLDQLDGGPRVVQTMKVERDGTITSGASADSPVAAPSPAGGVPGMILDGGPQRARAVPPASTAGAVLQAAEPPRPARVAVAALPDRKSVV